MASTTLVRDFIWRLSTALNDTLPQYTVWKEADIVNTINDGQLAIVKYVPTAFTRTGAFRLAQQALQSISKIAQVDFVNADATAVPAGGYSTLQLLDIPCNMGGSGAGEGKAIRVCARAELDGEDPLWRTRTGPLVKTYSYDEASPQEFEVFPRPDSNDRWVRLTFVSYPQKVPAGNDATPIYGNAGGSNLVLDIDDMNTDDLFWYCMARLNMKDVPQAKAPIMQASAASFLSSINAQVKAYTGKDPNLRMLPFTNTAAGAAQG